VHLHTHSDSDPRDRSHQGSSAALVTWAITFLLLSLVAAIFAFGGTAGEPAGLYAQVASVGFLVIAIVMFFICRTPRNQ
jgi:uncharacterized membrane protein YtjA (UPF0391 family)